MTAAQAKARRRKCYLARKALRWIEREHAAGRAVIVSTSWKAWRWTPALARKWQAIDRPPFKVAKDGDLLMAQGRSYVRLVLGCVALRNEAGEAFTIG